MLTRTAPTSNPKASQLAAQGVLLLSLAAAMGSMTAAACTSAQAGGSTQVTIDTWDDPTPGILISNWTNSGYAQFLNGCDRDDVVPITATSLMTSVVFIRDVMLDGIRYPAFSVRGEPRSPLIVFRHVTAGGSGQGLRTAPLDVRVVFTEPGTGLSGDGRWSVTQIATVSRGGDMTSLPNTSLGSITYQSPKYPTLVKTESFGITAKLRTKTCTLVAPPVELREIYATDLPSAGSSTGQRDFNVTMTCNGAFPVNLQLTDANEPGNSGSRLKPTANATAAGVHVQLLREGNPVVLGQTWLLPLSQAGDQDIALAARYYRTAGTFGPGAVEGQAVITATYR